MEEKKLTPGAAVRAMCLECLGAGTAATAFDCRSHLCPLYRCHPFRGKVREDVKVLASPDGLPAKGKASRALCREMCRACQDHRKDCRKAACPIFQFRPWQFGGGRRELSDEQRQKLSERAAHLRVDTTSEGES